MDKKDHTPHSTVLDEWNRMKEEVRSEENEVDHEEEDAKVQGPSLRLRQEPSGGLVAELRKEGTTKKTVRIGHTFL